MGEGAFVLQYSLRFSVEMSRQQEKAKVPQVIVHKWYFTSAWLWDTDFGGKNDTRIGRPSA